jgi:hypothetical protein
MLAMSFALLDRILRTLSLKDEPGLRGMFSDPDPLVSFRDEYPGVSLPDEPSSLVLLSVQWATGDIHSEKMPQIAADLLEQGYDAPSLRRLAGEIKVSCIADVEPLIRKMFTELGVHYPLSEAEAKIMLCRQTAREVIAGLRDPWRAAHRIEHTFRRSSYGIPEIDAISDISDEVDWDRDHRRSTPELKKALLNAFATLASIAIPES